ncbi:hypothetical protein [Novosphingopyxis sp.]|uniref:hypothetical protein n=1 Tax=Novosphingopyxis sp. TaxID=2709690 RepID=UPI003B595E0F
MDWGLATILGPILLVGVIAWALLRNKKDTSAADLRHTERATEELYDRADAEDAEDARNDPLA